MYLKQQENIMSGAKQRCYRVAIAAERRIFPHCEAAMTDVIAQRSLEERGNIYLPAM